MLKYWYLDSAHDLGDRSAVPGGVEAVAVEVAVADQPQPGPAVVADVWDHGPVRWN